MTELAREFLGTRLDNQAATGSWTEIFSTPDSSRDGILISVTSGTLEVNDNDTDTSRWYALATGTTFLVPFPPATRCFVKGTATYKAQQVRVRA